MRIIITCFHQSQLQSSAQEECKFSLELKGIKLKDFLSHDSVYLDNGNLKDGFLDLMLYAKDTKKCHGTIEYKIRDKSELDKLRSIYLSDKLTIFIKYKKH